MNRPARLMLMAGAVAMLAGVALGAFGAHVLRQGLSPEMLAIWQTGVAYHFYHALGLLALGLIASQAGDSRLLGWAGALMAAGILLFSGSLYLLALTGMRWLGAVPPFGGTAWIIAWALLLAALWRMRQRG